MSNEQKKYKSCPDCIDKGKTPSGETRDGINLECSTCDGTGQVEHPQEGKPLTADDILHKYFDPSFTRQLPETKTKTVQAMQEYAAQETAALREELATLRKIIEPRGEQTKPHSALDFLLEKFPNAPDLDWYTPVIVAMCSYAHHHTQRANDELSGVSEELERWETAYRHCNETSEARLKNNDRLRGEIGRLQTSKQEWADLAFKRKEELEAVKKERVEWINEGQKVMLQRDEVTRQRDEALDIASELLSQLKYVQEKFIQTGSTPGVITQCETRLSRLSSGETKPVNEWIRVSDRLPELGKAVDIYKEGEDMYNTARIEHRDIEGFFKWNEATHWRLQTPLPALSESLTDKK